MLNHTREVLVQRQFKDKFDECSCVIWKMLIQFSVEIFWRLWRLIPKKRMGN